MIRASHLRFKVLTRFQTPFRHIDHLTQQIWGDAPLISCSLFNLVAVTNLPY
jgi:hypothetical protein